jgi:hypothetical protein
MLDGDRIMADVNLQSVAANECVKLCGQAADRVGIMSDALLRLERPFTICFYCVGVSFLFWGSSHLINAFQNKSSK